MSKVWTLYLMLSIAVAVLASAGAQTGEADAVIKITPHQAALVTIEATPGFCRKTLRAIREVGYETTFLAFEAGYGESTEPPAAPVFHDIVRICQRRLA